MPAPPAHGSAPALLWKSFPSGLRLISSRSISSKMCLCPSGDRDSLLLCLHILSSGWGKEIDGRVSVISMGNRAMPGRWAVIL